MRPGSVEGVYINVEYSLELLLMQDEQVIETLASRTPQEAFTDGSRKRTRIYAGQGKGTRVHPGASLHNNFGVM